MRILGYWTIAIVAFVNGSALCAGDAKVFDDEIAGRTPSVSAERSREHAPTVTMLLGIDSDLGPRKAGFICGPNGRFELRDFIESQEDLEVALIAAFLREGIAEPGDILQSLMLEALSVNLCARQFFPGKSGNYSGEVNFSFLIVWASGRHSLEVVNLHIDRKDSLNEKQILRLGLIEVARRAKNFQESSLN